jgi:hypothetical protein
VAGFIHKTELILYLVEKKAVINTPDFKQRMILHHAVLNSSKHSSTFSVQFGVCVTH